jgi:hypothetical protein
MMPSSSTAKIQSCRDGVGRGDGGCATATGLIFFRKRQLCIMGCFARYPQAEASNVGQILVGPTNRSEYKRPMIFMPWKFLAFSIG